MIYFLLAALVFLGLFSYLVCGKDLFAPGTVIVFAFIFSVACSIYNIKRWKFDISASTVFVILSVLFITVLINGLVHSCYRRIKDLPRQEEITPIDKKVLILFIALILMVMLIMLMEIRRIAGSGPFAMMMLNFRSKNAYSADLTNQFSGLTRQLLNFISAACFVFLYNLFIFRKKLGFWDKVLNVVVIGMSIAASLLTGGRFSSLTMGIAAVVMWRLIVIEGNRSLRLRTIFKLMVIALAALYGFYAVKSLVGRESDSTVIDYITHYAGGGIPGLDLYFKNPPVFSDIWGKETFYSLNNGLRKLGILDIPYYIIHHEFRTSGGESIGNIYTAIRDYHYDFGFAGVYILHTAFSLFASIFYEYGKKRKSGIAILTLSMVYYVVPMYPISNYFYANIISFGFAIRFAIVFVLYKFLIAKKIRIKI